MQTDVSQDAGDTHRFRSAAPHYLAGRPAYSPRLIGRVALVCGVSKMDRVLDLGCGPAPLGVAFASRVAEVVGVDPESAMLETAARNAMHAGVALHLIEGRAEDLCHELGAFQLVVIGRAFHWMDRPRVLEQLDSVVEPDGAVVLFGSDHPPAAENAWLKCYRELLGRYAVDDAGRARRSAPDWPSHAEVLLASTFNQLERISVIERRETPVEAFVDRAFSMSSTAPGRLGPQAGALAQEVRDLAMAQAHDGLVSEVIESEALIGRRG